jgi:ABC-2 type transport system ATP-binding protein
MQGDTLPPQSIHPPGRFVGHFLHLVTPPAGREGVAPTIHPSMNTHLPLEVSAVRKTFEARAALDGVDLTIGAAEVVGLLGPNGAGKSTLVRAIAGRVRPDQGTIRIHGHPAGSDDAKILVGYVPQELALYPLLSVRENLKAFGSFLGLRGKPLAAAIDETLEWTALADRARDQSGTLSGGMRRRLNIGCGSIHKPKLLLLDEPTVGVDPQSRERIYAMIAELRAQGTSVLYTSHYMEEVERLCDRISIIDHGHVIANGTKDQLVEKTVGPSQELTIHTDIVIPAGVRASLARFKPALNGTAATVSVLNAAYEVPEVLSIFRDANVRVRDMFLKSPTLEAVFLALTGRGLRE